MKHLIMGTAGHVDHGKTSLIKALTSIDCDTHPQEKERGITINLGFSHLDLPTGSSLGIVDVPGHKDFINTMVSGATGIDFVLLVVAADSGIMPQTREHFHIVQTLGVKKMIIALNKIDLVDEELVELAKLEIMEWLEETPFHDSPIVGVSAHTSVGMEQLINEIESLIPEIPSRASSTFFRMYIDRLFSIKGKGTVIAGSVLNGSLNVNSELLLLPSNQKLRIKGMQRHGKDTKMIVSGDRAAINVSGLSKDEYRKGMLVSSEPLHKNHLFDVQVSLFPNSKKLKLWSNVILHAATFECQARMHLIDVDSLEGGKSCLAQIQLDETVVMLPKDRFIIRRSSGDETIGGGIILDNQPLYHRKRTQKLIQQLRQLNDSLLHKDHLSQLILLEVQKKGAPFKKMDLLNQLQLNTDDFQKDWNQITGLSYYQNSDIVVAEALEEKTEHKIVDILKNYHQQNPLMDSGMTMQELIGKFEHSGESAFALFFEEFLNKLNQQEIILKVGQTYVNSDHKVAISSKDKEDIVWLEHLIKNYGSQKPIYPEIQEKVKEKKISKEAFLQYMAYLKSTNKLLYYKGDYIHSLNYRQCRKTILSILKENEEGLYQQALKEKSGLSKKMLPFMCEILSSEKLVKLSDFNKNNFKTEITNLGLKFLQIQ